MPWDHETPLLWVGKWELPSDRVAGSFAPVHGSKDAPVFRQCSCLAEQIAERCMGG